MFDQLRTLVALRQACVASRTAETLRIKSLARRFVGWTPGAEPLKRKAFCAAGAAVATAALKGEKSPTGYAEATAALSCFGLMTGERLSAINVYIRELEKAVAALVEPLPVWQEWGLGVRGFGAQTLGTLLAESGDPSDYPKKGHLWKRFGLHVNGEGKAAKGEQGKKLGFSPYRRSLAIVAAENLIRAANPDYRAIYVARRETTAERYPDWTKLHSHNDARRMVAKRLLLELWRAWNRCGGYSVAVTSNQ